MQNKEETTSETRSPTGTSQYAQDAQPSPTALMQNESGEYVQVPVREAAARWETRLNPEYNRQTMERLLETRIVQSEHMDRNRRNRQPQYPT